MTSNFTDLITLVPSGLVKALCAPSQKGSVLVIPQEHQEYFLPASTSTLKEFLAAILGKDMSVIIL